jgi:hypothetical protein
MNRAGFKVVTKSSSGIETRYATPRVIQALMHWYYRCEAPSDETLLVETAMLYASGMLKPMGGQNEFDLRAACYREFKSTEDMGWLFELFLLVRWELTKAGKAWVCAILEIPPPVPPRSRRT